MVSGLLLFTFLGFFMVYNTSKRAPLGNGKLFESRIQDAPGLYKKLGVMILLISLLWAVQLFGVGAGLFVGCILWMTIASLVILIAPLRTVNFAMLTFIFVLVLLLELFIS